MEINAKALRAKRDAMAKKRAGGDPRQKVDASSWSPSEPLNADVKTGMRPISRRAYKDGGEVIEKMNRNQKTANEAREGIKHVGALKRGGRTKKEKGGGVGPDLSKVTNEPVGGSVRRWLRGEAPAPSATAPKARQYAAAKYNVVDEGGISKSGAPLGGYRGAKYDAMEEGNKPVSAPAKAPPRPVARASAPSGPTAGAKEADRLMDYWNTKDGVRPGGIVPKKRGGRAKKQAGGPMVDPAMAEAAGRAGVAPDRLGFAPAAPSGGVKKLLGLKKGGTARKGRATGGSTVTDLTGVRPTGGRSAHAAGGKAKGKTNINIVIATGKPQDAAMPGMPAPPPPMPPGMPAAGGAPPMMPPGMPGGMPMGRKSGGRAMKSYKDMTAGSLSGLGRLQKTAIAKNSMG